MEQRVRSLRAAGRRAPAQCATSRTGGRSAASRYHRVHAEPAPVRLPRAPARLMPGPATLLLPGALAARDGSEAGPPCPRSVGSELARLARRIVACEQGPPDGAPPFEPGHVRWLHAHLGLARDEATAACTAAPDHVAGAHWRLDPVHLHLGRDHLVLTDPARLELAEADALELAEAVAPLFADDGLALLAAGPRWYLRETDPSRPLALRTRSLIGALGRNVSAWMPTGKDARRWKRLLNEVQMTWFEHPVNLRREAAGRPPINGLWIDGRVPPAIPAAAGALARALDRDGRPPGGTRIELDGAPLVLDTTLLDARLEGDPRRGVDAWRATEATWFAPIAAGTPPWDTGARIVLAGELGWRTLRVAPRADWRFWRRADPAAWLIEPLGTSGIGPR